MVMFTVIRHGITHTTYTHTLKDITSREPPADLKDRKRPHEDPQSFFMWFSSVESPDDIGELIKDDIWPNPLHYFLVSNLSNAERDYRNCLWSSFLNRRAKM